MRPLSVLHWCKILLDQQRWLIFRSLTFFCLFLAKVKPAIYCKYFCICQKSMFSVEAYCSSVCWTVLFLTMDNWVYKSSRASSNWIEFPHLSLSDTFERCIFFYSDWFNSAGVNLGSSNQWFTSICWTWFVQIWLLKQKTSKLGGWVTPSC